MIGQMDIKRQLRYKDSIYDVLKDITLGNYNYLIIGKELDGKFIDIDFVEQKLDNGKIRYISPSSTFVFNKDTTDFKRVQSQSLMNYIVNEIKDRINQEKLINEKDTLNYIDNISKTIESSTDINGFFANDNKYENESQLEESIKALIGYYFNEIKDYSDLNKLPTGEVLVPEEDVKEIYNKLEDTQNFGVSLIHDAIAKEENSEDYIVDPTNNSVSNDMLSENSIFKPMSTDFTEQDLTDVKLQPDLSNDNSNAVATTQPQSTQLTETNSDATNNRNLSFQERLYLENEKKMHEQNVSEDLQNSLNAKTKTLTLKNNYGKMNNAAYITISWLLYIIGSFELFIAIFLMAKFF